MVKKECFEFTGWVVENYRKIKGLGYIRKGDRVSYHVHIMRIDELFELWKTKT